MPSDEEVSKEKCDVRNINRSISIRIGGFMAANSLPREEEEQDSQGIADIHHSIHVDFPSDEAGWNPDACRTATLHAVDGSPDLIVMGPTCFVSVGRFLRLQGRPDITVPE